MAEKYNNATKQTWRGWAWNQIASRGVLPGSVVIALAGESGLDSDIGDRKGFVPVGVDTDDDCVNHFRSKGGVAICDGVQSQVCLVRPSAVILDYHNGFNANNLSTVIDSVAVCDVVVVNMMRGRDSFKFDPIRDCEIPEYVGRKVVRRACGKHRGMITTAAIAKLVNEMWWLAEREDNYIPKCVFDVLRPRYYSYKSKDCGSSSVYYDSLAITTRELRMDLKGLNEIFPMSSRRKASAAKALLTMRRGSN